MRTLISGTCLLFCFAALCAAQEVKIPKGIRYKTAPDEVNEKAKALTEALFSSKIPDADLDGAFCKAICCFPALWDEIKGETGADSLRGATLIGPDFEVSKDGQTRLAMKQGNRFIGNEEKRLFWKIFSEKMLKGKVTVRKLTPPELAYYWAIYPFDIEEPIFIVESGKRRFTVDFNLENGKPKVFWLGIVQDLQAAAAPGQSREPAIIQAAQAGDAAKVEKLLDDGAPVDTKDSTGATALHVAAFGGHKDVVELLIARGAKLHARSKGLATALHAAAFAGHTDIAKLLIGKGVRPDVTTAERLTPLHFAAQTGQKETAKLLIDKGAKVNAETRFGATPLHWASLEGHVEVARLLLDKGANAEARDSDRRTPLHCAAAQGHLEVAELLLEKGADINAKDKDGLTPLGWAEKNGHKELAASLREHGKKR